MSAAMAAPAIHEWVDQLSPAQQNHLRVVINRDGELPPISEDASDTTMTSAFAAWVQAEVAPVMERIASGEEPGYSGDEVLEWLAARRATVA